MLRIAPEVEIRMRLLIVEDDPDGREMLAELFRMHQWVVTAVPTTHEAMTELRAGGFDVIISDENLEGESGSTMLREASAEGLLSTVGALMYTAESRSLEVPPGVRVLRKPLGIAKLLDAAKAVAPETEAEAPVAPEADPGGAAAQVLSRGPGSGARRRRHRVELVLYVTSSRSSQRALENLERVLETSHPAHLEVVVHDLEREPLDGPGGEAPYSSTPVLVRKHCGQEQRFVGDLESTHRLAALLEELDAQVPSSHASAGDSPPSTGAR